eukprot:571464-Amphidinium_carterae.2
MGAFVRAIMAHACARNKPCGNGPLPFASGKSKSIVHSVASLTLQGGSGAYGLVAASMPIRTAILEPH